MDEVWHRVVDAFELVIQPKKSLAMFCIAPIGCPFDVPRPSGTLALSGATGCKVSALIANCRFNSIIGDVADGRRRSDSRAEPGLLSTSVSVMHDRRLHRDWSPLEPYFIRTQSLPMSLALAADAVSLCQAWAVQRAPRVGTGAPQTSCPMIKPYAAQRPDGETADSRNDSGKRAQESDALLCSIRSIRC